MYEIPDLRYQTIQRNKEELTKHLEHVKLKPKFSMGIWYFSPGGGLFHDRFVPEKNVAQRIEILFKILQFLNKRS
jgi:xylose isomerase